MSGVDSISVLNAVRRKRHALILRSACLALVFYSGLLTAQSPPTAARVVSVSGELSVRRSRAALQTVGLHDTIQSGDELTTGPSGQAVIQAPNGSTIHIYPDSRIIYNEQSRDLQEWLHLFFGSIKVHIEKLSGRPNPHSMTTPTAVIAVRGTVFSVFVDDTDSTLVAVDEGIVAVANRASPADEVLLQRGQRTWVRGSAPPLRAQLFRGPSERADLIPWRSGSTQGSTMNSAMSGRDSHSTGNAMSSMGGMTAHPGPPH